MKSYVEIVNYEKYMTQGFAFRSFEAQIILDNLRVLKSEKIGKIVPRYRMLIKATAVEQKCTKI